MVVSEQLEQAEASYSRLTAERSKTPAQSADIEARLSALVEDAPVAELRTNSQRLFFVTRKISDGGITYRVFRNETAAVRGEEFIGSCEISRIKNGIAVIKSAEVEKPFQRKGIAGAVYDLISSDMVYVGGLLWPVPPRQMSDAEFKIWWRRSPALVFYYPHRHRLGLLPRFEFEELFDETLNRGFWERSLDYCGGLLSRLKWTACFGRFGR